jgi:hypothetical protein
MKFPRDSNEMLILGGILTMKSWGVKAVMNSQVRGINERIAQKVRIP